MNLRLYPGLKQFRQGNKRRVFRPTKMTRGVKLQAIRQARQTGKKISDVLNGYGVAYVERPARTYGKRRTSRNYITVYQS